MKKEKENYNRQWRNVIQRIRRDYSEQLYAKKSGQREEMDKFLEKYNLPRLNQKEIENMNRSITSTEI